MPEPSQLIEEATWVVIDIETTGMDPKLGDRICELAAVKLQHGRLADRFQTFINPQCPISFGAFQINQITQDLLEHAPLIEQVLPPFLEFIQGGVLVAYNAEFDFGFIKQALAQHGYPIGDYLVLDALILARRLLPALKKYAQWQVARELKISYGQLHRALQDAELTTQILLQFFSLLRAKDCRTVGDALTFAKGAPRLF